MSEEPVVKAAEDRQDADERDVDDVVQEAIEETMALNQNQRNWFRCIMEVMRVDASEFSPRVCLAVEQAQINAMQRCTRILRSDLAPHLRGDRLDFPKHPH